LTDINLDECFNELEVCDELDVSIRLNLMNEEEWKTEVESKPKLRTDMEIKSNVDAKKYVLLNLTRKERSLLAQLRSGILPLMIETGRFRNIPKERRTCPVCASNEIEDEIHFLFNCKTYEIFGNEFYHKITARFGTLDELNNFQKLRLFCTESPQLFAKYIIKVFDKRKSLLLI
jgi:hypothetical protein